MRNQWSVSGQTVAVMQLSGSDEMGRIERGVPSSRPGQYKLLSLRIMKISSSAADRPRNTSCPSVVSFNSTTRVSILLVTLAMLRNYR